MAEALGLLASIAGVAGAGVSLATTLYQFADAIGNAGFEVRTFASGVILISQMLTSLREILKSPFRVSDQAISTAQEIVNLCDEIMSDSQRLLNRLKSLLDRDDGKEKRIRLRILFYFQKPKFLFYRQCLDSLQLTLSCHLASINLAINQNGPELHRILHTQTEISIATVKDNVRRTSKSTRYLLSASDSAPMDDAYQFIGNEPLLRQELPNLAEKDSGDDDETLCTDVVKLDGFDTTLLEGLPSLDATICHRLASVQEKVIEIAEEAIEQSNTRSTLQVANRIPLAPAIKLDNPGKKFLIFRTQWNVNFVLPYEPCKTWEGLKYLILEIYKELPDQSFASLPLSKSGKGNARQAAYQEIQDGAFSMVFVGYGQVQHILKLLWGSVVAPDATYGLRFHQADLNHE